VNSVCLTLEGWDCSAGCCLPPEESRVPPLQHSAAVLFKVCHITQKLQSDSRRATQPLLHDGEHDLLNDGGFLVWFDFPDTGKVQLSPSVTLLSTLAVAAGTGVLPTLGPLGLMEDPAPALPPDANRDFVCLFVCFEADSFIQSFTPSFIVRHANTIVWALLTDEGPFSDFTKQYNPFIPIIHW